MRRFVVLPALVLFLGLAACSGQPQIKNPNKSAAESQADYDDCHGRAAVAAALAPQSADYDAIRMKSMDECMRQKGYEVKEAKWW